MKKLNKMQLMSMRNSISVEYLNLQTKKCNLKLASDAVIIIDKLQIL